LVKEIRTLFGKPVFGDRDRMLLFLRELEAKHGCAIQAIDADFVVSREHLISAARKALSAFGEGRNVAKNQGLEILRYASGERQIGRALAIGVSPTTRRIALVMVGKKEIDSNTSPYPDEDELAAAIDPDGLDISFDPVRVREIFHITDDEIAAVGEGRIPDLVLERVALVDTYR
jgi:KEOPS complex subunit Cgi121